MTEENQPGDAASSRELRAVRLARVLGLESVLDFLYDGIVVLWASGASVPLNSAATRLLGLRPEEGLPPFAPDGSILDVVDHEERTIPPRERPAQRALLDGETTRDALLGVVRSRDASGRPTDIRWMRVGAVPLPQDLVPDGPAALVTFVDVTAEQRDVRDARRRLEHEARHDALTGLPNRAHFNAHLTALLARAGAEGSRVGVAFIDVDRFKTINDSMGHAAGDELLVLIAERLQAHAGPDTFLARIGGDEFLLIAHGRALHDGGTELTRRMRASMRSAFHVSGTEMFVGVSAGVSFFPDDAREAAELVRNADSALYDAKQGGRGRIERYRPELTAEASERMLLEHELRRALRDTSFYLDWQPIIATDGGTLAGVEALLRWTAPDGRSVAPSTLIPVAEDSGLIRDLGNWVLDAAVAQLAAWHRLGVAPPTVAVNVSALQLRSRSFVTHVRETLARHEIAPSRLEIELTEGALFADSARTLDVLHDLAAVGVRVAVDDFGTGYSSLAYLQRFPLHRLKVDRSFVQRVPGASRDLAILRAIVQLGHTLDLEIVAEGVENQDQLTALAVLGCEYWQGFLASRPVNPTDIASIVARDHRAETPPAGVRAVPRLRPGRV